MEELINLPEDDIEKKEGLKQSPEQEEQEEEQEAAPAQVDVQKPKAPRAPRAPKTTESIIKSGLRAQPTTSIGWLTGYGLEETGWVELNSDDKREHQFYTYTSEGDLQVQALFAGEVNRVIPVSKVQPASVEYTADFFKTRAASAKAQEETYVQAKRDLKRIVLLYGTGGATVDEVLNANTQVAIEERKLNEIAKDPRKINRAGGAIESGLTMDTYDKGVLINPVVYTTYTTFPTESLWMPAPEPEVAAPQPLPLRQLGGSESNVATTPKRQYTAQQLAIIRSRMARK
jgi:hypothetical protein